MTVIFQFTERRKNKRIASIWSVLSAFSHNFFKPLAPAAACAFSQMAKWMNEQKMNMNRKTWKRDFIKLFYARGDFEGWRKRPVYIKSNHSVHFADTPMAWFFKNMPPACPAPGSAGIMPLSLQTRPTADISCVSEQGGDGVLLFVQKKIRPLIMTEWCFGMENSDFLPPWSCSVPHAAKGSGKLITIIGHLSLG